MGLESASFISQLVATNPVGAVDDYATADDHLRLIKTALQGSFPNIGPAAATAVAADFNVLTGADAAGVTAAELAFIADVTSLIQAQLDGKFAIAGGTLTGLLITLAAATGGAGFLR